MAPAGVALVQPSATFGPSENTLGLDPKRPEFFMFCDRPPEAEPVVEGPAAKRAKPDVLRQTIDCQSQLNMVEARKGERQTRFVDSLAMRRLDGSQEAEYDELMQCLQGVWYKIGHLNNSPIWRQEPAADAGAANASELFLLYVHDEASKTSKWLVTNTLDVKCILAYPDGAIYANGEGDPKEWPTSLCAAQCDDVLAFLDIMPYAEFLEKVIEEKSGVADDDDVDDDDDEQFEKKREFPDFPFFFKVLDATTTTTEAPSTPSAALPPRSPRSPRTRRPLQRPRRVPGSRLGRHQPPSRRRQPPPSGPRPTTATTPTGSRCGAGGARE